MTEYEILSLALGLLSVILLPLVYAALRGLVKWTQVEDKLDGIADKMIELVADKDRVHQEISRQMHEDRKATNERLQWLERNLWAQGHGGNQR